MTNIKKLIEGGIKTQDALRIARLVLPITYGRKLVISGSHGGLAVSKMGAEWLLEHNYINEGRSQRIVRKLSDTYGWFIKSEDISDLAGTPWDDSSPVVRSHPGIVRMTEELGSKGWAMNGKPEIVTLRDDVIIFRINEYDGMEWVEPYNLTAAGDPAANLFRVGIVPDEYWLKRAEAFLWR